MSYRQSTQLDCFLSEIRSMVIPFRNLDNYGPDLLVRTRDAFRSPTNNPDICDVLFPYLP
jgi:hypothetical protein